MEKELLQSRLSSVESKNPKVLAYLERRKELGVDENQCSYFIKRKKRFCSNKAVAVCEGSVCSMHTPEALEAARLQDEESRRVFEQRQLAKETLIEADDTGACSTVTAAEGAAKGGSVFVSVACSVPAFKRTRVSAPKRMINPFGTEVSPVITPALVTEMLARYSHISSRSMHIDVGCARGKCIANLARKHKDWNHLGVEIRNDLCIHAVQEYVDAHPGTDNLYFLGCNFVQSADAILSGLPASTQKLVSFQFPDPWRRTKHLRRLIIQPELVKLLRQHLCATTGSTSANTTASIGTDTASSSATVASVGNTRKANYIYCSSDCEDVARHMREQFTAAGFVLLRTAEEYAECMRIGMFVHPSSSGTVIREEKNRLGTDAAEAQDQDQDQDQDQVVNAPASQPISSVEDGIPSLTPELWRTVITDDHWLRFNPLGEPSERELVCEVDWRRVWRCVYVCR